MRSLTAAVVVVLGVVLFGVITMTDERARRLRQAQEELRSLRRLDAEAEEDAVARQAEAEVVAEEALAAGQPRLRVRGGLRQQLKDRRRLKKNPQHPFTLEVFPESYSLPGGPKFTRDSVPGVIFRETLPDRLRRLPPTDDAPTGAAAMMLANSWGHPKRWNARHHPTHFIFGQPKGGSTFLERCYSAGGLGSGKHRPYPKASLRWRDAQPPGTTTAIAFIESWNRTGYRRWDLQKEPRTYIKCGTPETTPETYYRMWEAFPPVEPASEKWEVLDATPSYFMNPTVAENVHADHAHDPTRPRFVLAWREDGLARSYSHFVMIQMVKRTSRLSFIGRLKKELGEWDRPECAVLLKDPESLMAADKKEQLGQVLRLCFNMPMYLGTSLPALGLRYWLHHFDPSQFTIVTTDSFKMKKDPKWALDVLTKAFNFPEPEPPCKEPGQHEGCIEKGLWESITIACTDPKAHGQKRAASYSQAAKRTGFSQGTDEERAPFVKLFARFDKMMLKLIADFKLNFVTS